MGECKGRRAQATQAQLNCLQRGCHTPALASAAESPRRPQPESEKWLSEQPEMLRSERHSDTD